MDASRSFALPVTVQRITKPHRTWQPKTADSRGDAGFPTTGVPSSGLVKTGLAKTSLAKTDLAKTSLAKTGLAEAGLAESSASDYGGKCCHGGEDACISRASGCEQAA